MIRRRATRNVVACPVCRHVFHSEQTMGQKDYASIPDHTKEVADEDAA
jgi:hypothetical protein